MKIIEIKYDFPKDRESGAVIIKSLEKLVLKKLRDAGLERRNLLYRAFPYKKVRKVLKYGTDDPKTEMTWAGHDGSASHGFKWVFDCAWIKYRWTGPLAKMFFCENKMAIIFYDRKFMDVHGELGDARPKKGKTFKDAAVALVLLKPN